ncbi:hypothetical protein ACNI3Q_04230 [Sphingomonas sp. FW199]|uniref:hypothetical protein n=1 Tax=Sphingomonas sp. FW199 TaxID=3400217 RepID=UPI003CFA226E
MDERASTVRFDALVSAAIDPLPAIPLTYAMILALHWAAGMSVDAMLTANPSVAVGVNLVISVVTIALVQWQFRAALTAAGSSIAPGNGRIVALYLLNLVATLGIALGVLLLVLPGIYVASRWAVAGAILIAEGRTIGDALGESWRRTRASVVPISALLILAVVPLGVALAAEIWFLDVALDAVPFWLSILTNGMLAISMMATTQVGVAAYRLLEPEDPATEADIFA